MAATRYARCRVLLETAATEANRYAAKDDGK